MKIEQTGYRKGLVAKKKTVVFRVTDKELAHIKRLAKKKTGGNISDLFRLLLSSNN